MSPTQPQPLFNPISFVSPISDTTRPPPSSTPLPPNASAYRRISTYLSDALTIEDTTQAMRRESVISDHMGQQAEEVRRANIVSTKDVKADEALREWRRESVDSFWAKYGNVGRDGRRGGAGVERDMDGETLRGESVDVDVGVGKGKWRGVIWGVKGGWKEER